MSSFEIINHSETEKKMYFNISTTSLICTFWRTNKFYSSKYKLSLITIIIIIIIIIITYLFIYLFIILLLLSSSAFVTRTY
jgi:hypothetical protein